jgi:hypothetical protein
MLVFTRFIYHKHFFLVIGRGFFSIRILQTPESLGENEKRATPALLRLSR